MNIEEQLLKNQGMMLEKLGEIKGIVSGHGERLDKVEKSLITKVSYRAAGLMVSATVVMLTLVTLVLKVTGVW